MPKISKDDIIVQYGQGKLVAGQAFDLVKQAKTDSGYKGDLLVVVKTDQRNKGRIAVNFEDKVLIIGHSFLKHYLQGKPELQYVGVGVMTHELAHLERRSYFVIAQKLRNFFDPVISVAASTTMRAYTSLFPGGVDDGEVARQISSLAKAATLGLHSLFCQREEYIADRATVKHGSNEGLARYLTDVVNTVIKKDPVMVERLASGEKSIDLAKEREAKLTWAEKVFRNHPPICKRIERLTIVERVR